jgi:hypothetical protein
MTATTDVKATSLTDAINRFDLTDEHKGRRARFLGCVILNITGKFIDFDVEVATVDGSTDYEIVLLNPMPLPGDRGLIYENVHIRQAVLFQMARWLTLTLSYAAPIGLSWGSALAQQDDRLVLVLHNPA